MKTMEMEDFLDGMVELRDEGYSIEKLEAPKPQPYPKATFIFGKLAPTPKNEIKEYWDEVVGAH